jgi:hypothetical protein
MIARLLIWNLFDSKTTLEELREQLPELPDGDAWVANSAQDRFGLISFSDELPDLERVRDLIGADAQIAEQFDVLSY